MRKLNLEENGYGWYSYGLKKAGKTIVRPNYRKMQRLASGYFFGMTKYTDGLLTVCHLFDQEGKKMAPRFGIFDVYADSSYYYHQYQKFNSDKYDYTAFYTFHNPRTARWKTIEVYSPALDTIYQQHGFLVTASIRRENNGRSQLYDFGLLDLTGQTLLPPVYDTLYFSALGLHFRLPHDVFVIEQENGAHLPWATEGVLNLKDVKSTKPNQAITAFPALLNYLKINESTAIDSADVRPTSTSSYPYLKGLVDYRNQVVLIPPRYSKIKPQARDYFIIEDQYRQGHSTEGSARMEYTINLQGVYLPGATSVEAAGPDYVIADHYVRNGEDYQILLNKHGDAPLPNRIYQEINFFGEQTFGLTTPDSISLWSAQDGLLYSTPCKDCNWASFTKEYYTKCGALYYWEREKEGRQGTLVLNDFQQEIHSVDEVLLKDSSRCVFQIVPIDGPPFNVNAGGTRELVLKQQVVEQSTNYQLHLAPSTPPIDHIKQYTISANGKYSLAHGVERYNTENLSSRVSIYNSFSNNLISSYEERSVAFTTLIGNDVFVSLTQAGLNVENLTTGEKKLFPINDFYTDYYWDKYNDKLDERKIWASRSSDGRQLLVVLQNNESNQYLMVDPEELTVRPLQLDQEFDELAVICLGDDEIYFIHYPFQDRPDDFHKHNNGILSVFDLKTGKPTKNYSIGKSWPYLRLANMNNAQVNNGFLTIIDRNGSVLISNLADPNNLLVNKPNTGSNYPVNKVIFDQASKVLYMFSATRDTPCTAFDTRSGKIVESDSLAGVIDAWSRITSHILGIHNGRIHVQLYNDEIRSIPKKESNYRFSDRKQPHLYDLYVSCDNHLIFVNKGGQVGVFDLTRFTSVRAQLKYQPSLGRLDCPENTSIETILSPDGYLEVRQKSTNEVLGRFNRSSALTVTEDGSNLVFLNSSENLSSINLITGNTKIHKYQHYYLHEFHAGRHTNSAYFSGDKITGRMDQESKSLRRMNLDTDKVRWLIKPKQYPYSIGNVIEINKDTLMFVLGHDQLIFFDLQEGKELSRVPIPIKTVSRSCHIDDLGLIAFASGDGKVAFYDLTTQAFLPLQLFVEFTPSGLEYLLYDESLNVYTASNVFRDDIYVSRGGSLRHLRGVEESLNRPDSILHNYSFTDQAYAEMLTKVIERRTANQGTGLINNELSCQFTNRRFQYHNESGLLPLTYQVKGQLDSDSVQVNISVNDVIVARKNSFYPDGLLTDSLSILLEPGENTVEIYSSDLAGTISSTDRLNCVYTPADLPPKSLYFIGLSNANYQYWDSLSFSNIDLRSVSRRYANAQQFDRIIIDTLVDHEISPSDLNRIRGNLQDLSPQDYVVVFLSGHGKTNEATGEFHFIGPHAPTKNFEEKSLCLSDLEKIIQASPARNRLMLIDACESGQVDRSGIKIEPVEVLSASETEALFGKGLFYNSGIPSSAQEQFYLMQQLFSDYDNPFGGTIIAASTGYQQAFEHPELGHGVFTYFLLKAIDKLASDENNDQQITASELVSFLDREIEQSEYSTQKVTIRALNLRKDLRVW
ncbi:caspase family protein [Neolewinella persica]|uniref:caspase family protein n=1 Tax=Neolewinella persica TaxID=70998 RepID=UPI00146CD30A|nr:caspase family protein [Neolewinella persica]